MSDTDLLVQCIGEKAFKKLSETFGGQRLYIPKRVFSPERDEEIRSIFITEITHGSTCMNAYKTAAETFDISIRRVQDIISKSA